MHDPLKQKLSVGPEEAARMIGIGRTNMFGLIANGTVKSRKLGSRRVVLVSSLRELIGDTDGDSHVVGS
ncbi:MULTISPECIES: helix-turn-helix domain-containing protein [unclassified Sphingobium]|uniref:helix-turn-helix domain-containing protein n=1 Tax=unclassified Sphingobium TaxID=2611147 RepID=UPI000D16AC4A|nr:MULTISPECIES: helix-turn-helix domain-containing protein [unclassified Sphingobium]PSO12620.1 DNA-binding protein [Sphingobium sp. AEW4]TWD09801.1 hypothetical protein FB595_104148 [Sphingobium sp. AEW010]TWD26472.1 hypothetical protein FB596_104148 [Sphingobium sp. AEW013]TWD27759.1 hypothetical protein FB594_105180 [Sphingobium sp. AEW001]